MTESCDIEEVVSSFAEENRQEGLRVLLPAATVPEMTLFMWKRPIIWAAR